VSETIGWNEKPPQLQKKAVHDDFKKNETFVRGFLKTHENIYRDYFRKDGKIESLQITISIGEHPRAYFLLNTLAYTCGDPISLSQSFQNFQNAFLLMHKQYKQNWEKYAQKDEYAPPNIEWLQPGIREQAMPSLQGNKNQIALFLSQKHLLQTVPERKSNRAA